MKVAALDLGTNTFLCLICEVSPKTGIEKVYKDMATVVRLGQGVNQSRAFHPEALIRARQTLAEFKKEIEVQKVDRILAMATSAARDVTNGDELLKIGRDLGIPIEIIPGSDEARITYKGATVGHMKPGIKTLVVDVGGGSTELIVGQGEQLLFSRSLDIGGVRLTEKFISNQPVSLNEQKTLNDFINMSVQKSLDEIKTKGVDQILAVAGTPTSIAAIETGGFVEEKVDGYILNREKLEFWQQKFANSTIEEKQTKYGLGGRADIIYAGVSILLSVLNNLGLNEMKVSTKGVRYGVAMEVSSR